MRIAKTEMLTAKSRTRKPTLLSQTGVGRITRSQSRLLSESEDTREILNQGRKRKRSTHSNGLGKAIEQGPGSEQSTKARRIVQEDIDGTFYIHLLAMNGQLVACPPQWISSIARRLDFSASSL